MAAEPQTGRREVSALTDARKTLAYDFFRILRAPLDIHKKNRYASYDLRRKIEMQHEEFQKMTEREQVPLLKSPE
ncbi:hypothetical protein HIE55_003799 [Escherichia coli]|nr:hypothetical protein [Escherichia coli]